MYLIIFISIASGTFCTYNERTIILNSYLSEKSEKNRDLTCPSCKQDCELLKTTLSTLPNLEEAMLGRQEKMQFNTTHYLLQTPIVEPFPKHLEVSILAMGCFWGVEKLFWKEKGVIATAVGYVGGLTPNPNYEEAYTGHTGHTEAVKIVFDPRVTSFRKILRLFWENHDPTQGMRQGEDLGTQYRSMILAMTPEQREEAIMSRSLFQKELYKLGMGTITTQITPAFEFYYAEDYHQQYLSKRPGGYCGIAGTGAYLPKSFE